MVSFDLWVHVHVDPPIAGWKVQLYWRSPDPGLQPPYSYVGPITEYTDEMGEAFFDMNVSYTGTEYWPIPIIIVIPDQVYPGPVSHTYGGVAFEGYESPEKEAVGWTHFREYVTLEPRGGSSADVLVKGKALGGYPPPDMTLEILVDGAPAASRTILAVSIGSVYELEGVLDVHGLHQVQGRMVLSNPLGSPVYLTEALDVDIVGTYLATVDILPKCDVNLSQGRDPDSTVRDGDGEAMTLRRHRDASNLWGLLSFDLEGLSGITDAEFGAYCYGTSGIDSDEDTLLYSVQPFSCPFRFGDAPSVISSLDQRHVESGQWFKANSAAVVNYVKSREGKLACFELYCTRLSGRYNSLTYYAKETSTAFKPYLRVTYLKYA